MTPDTLWGAYHFAFMFWFGISAGCFILLLIHHAIRGAWALPFQSLLEAGTRTLIPMWILFFVMLLGMNTLYPWTDAARVHADAVLTHKAGYLNLPGFLIRSLVTMGVWALFASKLLGSTRRQAKTMDAREADFRASWGAAGIVVFALTATMTYTDWIMSRDPHWYSTLFPLLLMVGQALAAIAFCILYMTSKAQTEPFGPVVTPKLTRDMGNMMLTCTMLWAYFTFSQYVIIWSGNLPEETGFFHHRLNPSWNIWEMLVVILQFFAPFLLLLSGRTKRTPDIIRNVAIMVLVARFMDIFWTIAPFTIADTMSTTPMNVLGAYIIAWLVLGAVWWISFEFFRKQTSPLPTYDPRLELAQKGAAANHA